MSGAGASLGVVRGAARVGVERGPEDSRQGPRPPLGNVISLLQSGRRPALGVGVRLREVVEREGLAHALPKLGRHEVQLVEEGGVAVRIVGKRVELALALLPLVQDVVRGGYRSSSGSEQHASGQRGSSSAAIRSPST